MFGDRNSVKNKLPSMSGKNCVITGGTSGIGKATALELGKMGSRIIFLGRNSSRGRIVANRINSFNFGGSAEFIKCDLSSQKEIFDAAKAISILMPSVDILVNNAGAKFKSFCQSQDGIEMTFATNHLSHFILTALLINNLLNASYPRIIFVAGQSHWGANIDFEKYMNSEHYDRRIVANQAKLANLLLTYDLAIMLRDTPITINAVHPGGVATRIGRNNGLFFWMRHIVAHLLHGNLISPKKAADTIVWLASSNEIQNVSGKYFFKRKQIDSSPESQNKEAQRHLWDLSLRLSTFEEKISRQFSNIR